MSKKDSVLSKEQQNLLKQFKKQISNPHSSTQAAQQESKKTSAGAEETDDLDLFKKALQGVKPLQNSNIAQVKPPVQRKLDAPTSHAESRCQSSQPQLPDCDLATPGV